MGIVFHVCGAGGGAIDLSNANGSAMLRLMGVGDPQPFGELTGQALRGAAGKLTAALLLPALRVQAWEGDRDLAPNVHSFGRDDDYVLRTARRLLALVESALFSGAELHWD